MSFWLEKGIYGFRCDVINIIYKNSLENGKKRFVLTGLEHYLSTDGNHQILQELRRDVLDKFELVEKKCSVPKNKYKDMFLEVAGDRQEYLKNISSVQIPSTEYGYDSMIDGIYYFQFNLDRAKEDFNKYYYFK